MTIIKGNAKDVESVKQLLVSTNGQIVDAIVFGIGFVLKANPSLTNFVDDPIICQSATATLLAALAKLKPAKKPLLVTISTTGISELKRDVPLRFAPLYHTFLAMPPRDKMVMEQLLKADAAKSAVGRVTGGVVLVRPSLLINCQGNGLENIRVGVGEKSPVVGYTIGRKDVCVCIFEKLLSKEMEERMRDEVVTLTY